MITAERHSRPAHCTVRTLMAIGCITVAVSIADTKLVSMVTIPPRNMQAITPPLSMSSTRRRITPSIAIVQAVLPQSGLKIMNLIPSLLQR